VAPDPNNLGQTASEVPASEAQLIGLLDTVQTRLASLGLQLQTLNKDLRDNQAAIASANVTLAAREAGLARIEQQLADLDVQVSEARAELRARAVAAYMDPPAEGFADLVLHVRQPSDLVALQGFWDSLVDAQSRSVKKLTSLQHQAAKAAMDAVKARDLASRQRQSVTDQETRLKALQSTYVDIQRQSQEQQSQQTALLGQAAAQKAVFEAAVQQQQAESDAIAALLRQVEVDGGPAIPAASGLLGIPIPGAPITSPFGPRIDPILGGVGFHPGVDFGARMGTPIEAAGDGIVVWAGPNGGYGNCTIIDHGHGLATLYAHQSRILVQVGDQVTRSQIIGQVGTTGDSTGPHLHFEVRVNGTPVDPLPYL
jgi:murein DD-endopeptidase MepM/ murein hydrolase activator NlpD